MGAVLAKFVSLAMMSIFIQNAIFDRALGANVAIYASRNYSRLRGFTLAITAMTTVSSAISYFIEKLVLPTEYGWLFMPLIYVGIISVLYVVVMFLMWKFFHPAFKKVHKYAHLTVFNCTVIGALLLNSTYGSDLTGYIGYGFGTGIGFFLAGFLLNMAHERLDSDKIPRLFRGYPIMLIYIGIVSLAFHILVGYTAEF